jgi:hypothetical protein
VLDLIGQYTTDGGGGGGGLAVLYFVFYAVVVAGMWGIFVKAGEEGWKAIIPIYNWYILLKIVGRPWWWILLFLIPIVNLVILILMYNDLSKSFGKGAGFTVGLIFLGIIFFPILGFGSAQYIGPGGTPRAGPAIPPPPPPMPTA